MIRTNTFRIFCSKDSVKNDKFNKMRDLGKKSVTVRREQLSGIIGIFKEIGTSEINRTKGLFEEHKKIFLETPEPIKTEVQPIVINDDSYFEK